MEQRAASIFVHVADLRRSAEWYNKLLGLPLLEDRFNGGPVYWYNLQHTNLILDNDAANQANPEWQASMKPRIMFKTSDIDEAYAYVKEMGEPFLEPEQHGSVMAYFNFRDPEGNAQMVCWTSEEEEDMGEPIGTSPILPRIGAVFIDVKDMTAMSSWYADLLGIPADAYHAEGEVIALPSTKGGGILLDANRHLQGNDFTIPFMFVTEDLEASLVYAKVNGFELFGEPQYYGPVSFFVLKDPDGNLVMVCREETNLAEH
ncbi:VOC family protein [Paenibacillus sp. R14(2021)]|uniref:VOC family protein n=1 Tax=Paenibacillus sp. R14(2021) TaxID=2859228 RepID=UPI001C615475|nr:VOC family protein [Paenibacillus sp. R14(2021)]